MVTWFRIYFDIFRFSLMSQKREQFSYGTFGGIFGGFLVPLRCAAVSECIDVPTVHGLRCAPVMHSSVGFSPPLNSHPNFDGEVGNIHGDSGDCQSYLRGKRTDSAGNDVAAVVKQEVLIGPDHPGHLVHVRYAVQQMSDVQKVK